MSITTPINAAAYVAKAEQGSPDANYACDAMGVLVRGMRDSWRLAALEDRLQDRGLITLPVMSSDLLFCRCNSEGAVHVNKS
ncbi:MAG: hypothetical protein GEU71_14175 [Actinobacteria bacterium]|nr:hypothetical protein [Actinomycetota bacterium]